MQSRDLKKVGNKLLQVLHPNGDRDVLRDCKSINKVQGKHRTDKWNLGDLWGPLLLCLTLAM